MMAGSRTFTVLRFVFLMLLMRCDGNALDLPVHLSGKEATVTKFRCDARTDEYCVTVSVTECPVTAHVCLNGAVQINNATRDGCLIASRAGINEKGLPFIEVFVDNLSLTKQAECTNGDVLKTDTIPAIASPFNATKMTFCAGDAMVEVYIFGTRDYHVHIDTETNVCVFPAPTPSLIDKPPKQVPPMVSIAVITVPICLLAVICVIVILAFFFRKRRPSRRLDVPDDSHEAISLQTVTTSNGSEESSRNNSNDGLIESTRV